MNPRFSIWKNNWGKSNSWLLIKVYFIIFFFPFTFFIGSYKTWFRISDFINSCLGDYLFCYILFRTEQRLSYVLVQIHSFFYKDNFIRTKALVLVKNLRTSQEQSQACCPAEHENKVSRLAVSKIIRAEHQNRTWLPLMLYCM